MMRGKLLVIAPSAYTLSGLATWLNYLLPGLAGLGWDVTLGLVSGPRHHCPAKYLALHPFSSVEVIHCACSTPVGRVEAVRIAIRKTKPAVVLTVNIPDALKAAALERVSGHDVRAVMSCHGIQEDLFSDMKSLTSDIDAVVCTNRLACRLASSIGQIPEDRVFHAACGVQVPECMPVLPENPIFTIGYSGRLEQPQKRIHDLIEIAVRLRAHGQPFRILIAGSGPAQNSFCNRMVGCGLGHHFEMLGTVSPEQLSEKLYQVSDALIVPSSWETGPLVIWEAMAAGAPVVTSRYTGSGLESLLWHDKNCLMFDVGDTSAAAAEIIRLQSDHELRSRIRSAAFSTVCEKLSWEVSVANWDKILQEVCQRPGMTSLVSPPSPASGRLSRILGEKGASIVRFFFRRLPPDSGPGGEWPHAVTGAIMPECDFLEFAMSLDRRETTGGTGI